MRVTEELDIPIVPILAGTLAALYFGFQIEKQRKKLREVFDVFDKKESAIADALERMVESGELKAYVPGQSGPDLPALVSSV
jgi:hypothetical protein